jgi:hypothetical protein
MAGFVDGVDLVVDELDLVALRFERWAPARTGRQGYHPSVLLKLFIYGHLNRITVGLDDSAIRLLLVQSLGSA